MCAGCFVYVWDLEGLLLETEFHVAQFGLDELYVAELVSLPCGMERCTSRVKSKGAH